MASNGTSRIQVEDQLISPKNGANGAIKLSKQDIDKIANGNYLDGHIEQVYPIPRGSSRNGQIGG